MKTRSVEVHEEVLPSKRKRFNKNKKKAWRKKIDITDIEDDLEQKRREERHGGLLEERKSEDLLFLDLDGGEKTQYLQTNTNTPLGSDKPETAAEKRAKGLKPSKRLASKPLKAHSLLNGLPGVKDPLKKRNRVRLPVERRDPFVAKKFNSETHKAKVLIKHNLRKQQREVSLVKKSQAVATRRIGDYGFDLWSFEEKKDETEESYTKDFEKFFKTKSGTKPSTIPGTLRRPTTALPSVQVPKKGQSYNPTYKDHQKLLSKAVKQEDKRLKELDKWENQTTKMFPTADKAPTAETWLKEMSEGLQLEPTQPNEEQVESNQVEGEQLATTSGKRLNQKKTRTQRNKEKYLKKAAVDRKQTKVDRIRANEIHRLRTYKKELEARENTLQVRKERRSKKMEKNKYLPKRLCSRKFLEDDVAVALGHELPDTLRQVKPVGSVLEDRFRSLQRRNLIETRLRHKVVKKFKPKMQVKRGYRGDYEDYRKTSC